MKILLLIRTRHLPSEGHGYLSTFQYFFEILLNQTYGGMVYVYAKILINREKRKRGRDEKWVGCELIIGFIT